jgi:sugar phosphate isomerase/epimerase
MSRFTRRGVLQGLGAVGAGAVLGTGVRAGAADAPAEPTGAPKFQLGVISYMVASKWDVPTLIDVCKKSGVAAVELRTTHAHGVEPSLSAGQRAEVKKRFEDSGIVLWGLGSVCEFHSPDESVVRQNIETCKQFVQLAHDVGAKGVKVRPNGLPDGVPVEKTVEQIGKSLVPCGQAGADAGVEIWVEVHGKGTAQPAVMKQIMEGCGHKSVGVTWNSNPEDVADGSVAASFALLKPWIMSVHVNNLWRDAAGIYPYRELFRLLRESGYDRYTLCEDGVAFPDPAAGEHFLRYYKGLWSELGRP